MSVADLLVPNPYPLNVGAISAPSLTTGALTIDSSLGAGTLSMTTGAFHPIQVNNTSATSGNDIVFLNNGVLTSGFGLNNGNNDTYAWTFAATPFKIGTANTERLRIPAAGIAVNEAATHALAQAGTTTVVTRTLDGGAYAPTWITLSGFTAFGTPAAFFSRNGNTVNVSVTVPGVSAAAGINQSVISIPFPVTPFFSNATELIGVATLQSQAVTNTATIVAHLGASSAEINVIATAAMAGDLTATFMYQIF